MLGSRRIRVKFMKATFFLPVVAAAAILLLGGCATTASNSTAAAAASDKTTLEPVAAGPETALRPTREVWWSSPRMQLARRPLNP